MDRKWEISTQSGNWYKEDAPEESIRFIRECGFEGIDYNIGNLFTSTFDATRLTSFFDKSIPEMREYYQPMIDAAHKYGIHISQAHGLFPIFYHPDIFPEKSPQNDYLLKVTEKMMAVCDMLDCRYFVVHPVAMYTLLKTREREINLNLYRRLLPAAKKYNITICLENLLHWDKSRKTWCEGICCDPMEACDYIDTLNAEAGAEQYGLCFDVGHAHAAGKNLYHYVTTLGTRIKVLHLHENNSMTDAHMMPFTQPDAIVGQHQSLPWESFLKALKEIEYSGPLSFETFRAIDFMPPALRSDALKFIGCIGSYFRTCLESGYDK